MAAPDSLSNTNSQKWQYSHQLITPDSLANTYSQK